MLDSLISFHLVSLIVFSPLILNENLRLGKHPQISRLKYWNYGLQNGRKKDSICPPGVRNPV